MPSGSSVALVSANIGGIDPLFRLPVEPRISSVYYTDSPAEPEGWGKVVRVPGAENPRLAAKRYKCQVYRLPETQGAVWLAWADASLRFVRINFVVDLVRSLELTGHDAAFVPHPNRRSPAAEYDYILGMLRNGSPSKPAEYLRQRYDAGSLEREREHFEARGNNLAALPLWCGGFWVVRNVPKVHRFLDEWWETVQTFSILDQPAISPLLVEHGVTVLPLDVNVCANPYWERAPHE